LYHPETGRFTTRDPHPTPLNKYQAFTANPIEHTDPTGNLPFKIRFKTKQQKVRAENVLRHYARTQAGSGVGFSGAVTGPQMRAMYKSSGLLPDGSRPLAKQMAPPSPIKSAAVFDSDGLKLEGDIVAFARASAAGRAERILGELPPPPDLFFWYRKSAHQKRVRDKFESKVDEILRGFGSLNFPDPETRYHVRNVNAFLAIIPSMKTQDLKATVHDFRASLRELVFSYTSNPGSPEDAWVSAVLRIDSHWLTEADYTDAEKVFGPPPTGASLTDMLIGPGG
ncbi:hypothetical protein, partial [Streptomyces sp. NRRL F-2664]|uniref:hypothetical protein n=1 Tax=Streptomyces sp. NRRL F-2664 TaxID=1463842 RepID=UPI0018FE355F